MAMGTEGVGFWFRGPNNFVRNNVAANFQNPTTEAALRLRRISCGSSATSRCRIQGRDGAPQFTTRNGNNMPILQFENNEAYGAMQGGFTLWWVSSQDPQPCVQRAGKPDQGSEALEHLQQDRLHVSEPEDHVRRLEDSWQLQLGQPLLRQRRLLRGLLVKGDHHPQLRHPGDGGRHHRARSGLRPGAEPHDREHLPPELVQPERSDQRFGERLLDAQQARGREQHAVRRAARARLDAVSMVRDVASAPECLGKLDEMRVYAYNGVATDNFQVYHSNTSVLPRPPAGCTPTTRAGINGLVVPDRGRSARSPPTATLGRRAAVNRRPDSRRS